MRGYWLGADQAAVVAHEDGSTFPLSAKNGKVCRDATHLPLPRQELGCVIDLVELERAFGSVAASPDLELPHATNLPPPMCQAVAPRVAGAFTPASSLILGRPAGARGQVRVRRLGQRGQVPTRGRAQASPGRGGRPQRNGLVLASICSRNLTTLACRRDCSACRAACRWRCGASRRRPRRPGSRRRRCACRAGRVDAQQ